MGQLVGAVRAISVVTVAEMRRGAIEAKWGEPRRAALAAHFRTFALLGVDSDVAEAWARLAARCTELGRRKADNDLWIAATALRHKLTVATLDRDFHDIPGITLIRADGSEVAVPA